MRRFSAFVLASTLFVSSAYAAGTSTSASLAPGKPAGVREAAMRAPLWVWIAGVGFVALGVGLVASGNGNGHSGGSTTNTHL